MFAKSSNPEGCDYHDSHPGCPLFYQVISNLLGCCHIHNMIKLCYFFLTVYLHIFPESWPRLPTQADPVVERLMNPSLLVSSLLGQFSLELSSDSGPVHGL